MTVIKGDQPDGTVAYEFPALIKLADLRTGYRASFKVTEITPPPPPYPPPPDEPVTEKPQT
ncbi:MAG: hypothetical protein EOP21_02300 [Hyphomicrobiales bacterium]|nr:MAG: hypothetical protein EOP21_02300 [Hyphomicrobiales bacterium]